MRWRSSAAGSPRHGPKRRPVPLRSSWPTAAPPPRSTGATACSSSPAMPNGPPRAAAAPPSPPRRGGAVVLVVRLAGQVEAVVVTSGGVRADPAGAAALLERDAGSPAVPLDRAALELALRRAAPLVRSRLEAIERARWRAADRDRLTRRLIPWVLAAA